MARREPHWVKLFLRELERTGNVRLAAERAGVDFTSAYQRRKRHAEFAERWEGALLKFETAPPARPVFTPPVPAALPLEEERGLIIRPSQDGSGALVRAPHALTSPRWGKRAEERFLTELTLSANVRRAAEAAGFSTTAVYKRRLKDQRLAAAWDAALETGKARVQAFLVEAASRTFDPDELPIADERELPKVSVSEAINIAKLGSSSGARPSTGSGRASWQEDGGEWVSNEEFEEARERIVERLVRLRENMDAEERETGKCRSCGQVLPNVTPPQPLPIEGRGGQIA